MTATTVTTETTIVESAALVARMFAELAADPTFAARRAAYYADQVVKASERQLEEGAAVYEPAAPVCLARVLAGRDPFGLLAKSRLLAQSSQ